ncbi:MAG: iron ABC transporter permease, partial [Armatimonadetes bacterium]|nr:iron ABC transporter permease [Armatimonadota bacterium]
YILGVSSGAAIGGAVAQVFHVFVAWNWLAGPLASTAAGLLTLPLVLAIGTSRRGYSTQTLLIGGVVLGFLLYAVNTLVMLLGGLDTNQTLRWLLGSATNAAAPKVWLLLFVFVVACLLLRPLTRSMNLLSAGEDQARILGVDPGRLHLQLLTITTISTAAVVGTMGIIGFIGLVAPHISRRCFGNDLRHGLWTSTAIGAVLLLCADACSKRLNEIPLGAFTAIVGAPVLLYLLRRD